jgi:lipoyl(octanoyl) transferase
VIQYLYLGRMGYDDALQLQAQVAAWRYEGRVGNVLLLLEHPPVLTLGRNADRANVLASDDLLAARGVTLHQINRGGDVTYHGPGQLVGYPIFDLRSLRNPSGGRMGPVDFVRRMEEVLIRVCGAFGLRAGRIPGLTGVWCDARGSRASRLGSIDSSETLSSSRQVAEDSSPIEPERKIAAIGIHVSRGITSHGFAFNVSTDLRDFQLINPCGITDKPVTSLEQEVRRTAASAEAFPTLEAVAHEAARQFGMVFDEQVLAVESIEALASQSTGEPAMARDL